MPIVLGSDKTTVLVATSQNDFYLLYLSVGNVRNNMQCAHRNGLVLIGFLAMPKSKHLHLISINVSNIFVAMKEHVKTNKFCQFCHQLFHSSLSFILQLLKLFMTAPDIVCFGDGHFHHVIYGIGPYITDYEEQVLLACIVHM